MCLCNIIHNKKVYLESRYVVGVWKAMEKTLEKAQLNSCGLNSWRWHLWIIANDCNYSGGGKPHMDYDRVGGIQATWQ